MKDLIVLLKSKDAVLQSLRVQLQQQSAEVTALREMQAGVLKAQQYLATQITALDRMHSDKKNDASLRNHAFVVKNHLSKFAVILGVDIEN